MQSERFGSCLGVPQYVVARHHAASNVARTARLTLGLGFDTTLKAAPNKLKII